MAIEDYPITEPVTGMLNRVQAVADARDLVEAANPLLSEIVNYSTWVFRRCISGRERTHFDLPALTLYLHIIEITDGVQILVSQSCSEPTVPLIRSSFEAFLSLEYLLKVDYKNRALCWLFMEHKRESRKYSLLDPVSQEGKKVRGAVDREYPQSGFPEVSKEHLDYIRSRSTESISQHVEEEYKRTRKRTAHKKSLLVYAV